MFDQIKALLCLCAAIKMESETELQGCDFPG